MLSNKGRNEQPGGEYEDALDDLPEPVSLGRQLETNDHFETFFHDLSETEPSFLVIGSNEIKIDLVVKQGIDDRRVTDLATIEDGFSLNKVDLERFDQSKIDKNAPWRLFLKKNKNGLVVILFSDDEDVNANENRSRTIYNLMKKLGLESVYFCNCNFGIPKFTTPTTKVDLEKSLKETYSKSHSVGASMDEFQKQLDETRNEPPVSTGYKKLDEILDGGLYPGLYLFGADTSLGKSTFWLNVALNASNKGRSVLYFSIEMSSFELKGRLLSRETYLLSQDNHEHGHAQTERTLTNWSKYNQLSETDKQLVEKARTLFEHQARNLYIFENINEITAETIQKEVINFMVRTGSSEPPLVIVDYLQILHHKDKFVDANDKLKMDRNLFFFKKLSNKFRVPIVCISSFNRDAYKEYKRLQKTSFKDSGNVEYTSDVLIGMQLEKLFRNKQITQEQAEDELNSQIREIDLVILKNRHGQSSIHDHFVYHTWFNDFSEVIGLDRYPKETDVQNGTGKPYKPSYDDLDDDETGFLE